MKYLECIKDGIKKNYNLDFKSGDIILGRHPSCHIILDNEYISKEHLSLSLDKNQVVLTHLSKKNPIQIGSKFYSTTKLNINDSFQLAVFTFFLKERETKPEIYKIKSSKNPQSGDMQETETKTNLHLFDKNKLFELQIQQKSSNPKHIFRAGAKAIKSVFSEGSFYLVSYLDEQLELIDSLDINNLKDTKAPLKNLETLLNSQKDKLKIRKKKYYKFKIFNKKHIKLFLIYTVSDKIKFGPEKLRFLNDFIFEFIQTYNAQKIKIEKADQFSLPIYTNNKALINILKQLKNISQSNLKVLIEGETGVGKELISRYVFNHYSQNKERLIAINCSTLPENLIEAELFGYEKGAFTDAKTQRKGKIEEANNGTLVLDEIGELPLTAQAKLLRALQEKVITRLGSSREIQVEFNLISMTNRNLKKMVSEGLFREDLFFRIAEFSTTIPPLRERKEDIYPLIEHFMEKHQGIKKGFKLSFTENAIKFLENHKWTGNVRELENLIKTLISISDPGELISESSLKSIFGNRFIPLEGDQINREYLLEVMKKCKWNKTKVANYLNISRTLLYRKLKAFNIDDNEGI